MLKNIGANRVIKSSPINIINGCCKCEGCVGRNIHFCVVANNCKCTTINQARATCDSSSQTDAALWNPGFESISVESDGSNENNELSR